MRLADLVGLKQRHRLDRRSGQAALVIAVNTHRESSVNVLEVMAGLQQAIEELECGPLGGAGLSTEQVYDETVYIYRSLQMLGSNLMLGILLAIAVLWWFMRRLRVTLLVAGIGCQPG